MASRFVRTEHRILTGSEILLLIVLDEHRGKDPLKLRQIERRMVPHPANESFIASREYIEPGKMPTGKPVKGSWRITDEGRSAINLNIRGTITNTESEIAKARAQGMPSQGIKALEDLLARLKEKEPGYPKLEGQSDADDDKSGGDADDWNEWDDDRHKGDKEDQPPAGAEDAGKRARRTPPPPSRQLRNAPKKNEPKPAKGESPAPVSKAGKPKPRQAPGASPKPAATTK